VRPYAHTVSHWTFKPGPDQQPGFDAIRQDRAKVAGLGDRTGSITPGKKADILIIDGGAVNVAPNIDPVAAVVLAADVSNVKTVLIDGVIQKRDGRLVDSLDRPRQLVQASRDFLVGSVEPQAGWIV
jgi:cytosine/adenosine deaminase-related metal-dependent hydrolase